MKVKEKITVRILIAEDDVTSRVLLAGVLKKSGFEVVETVNGAEAWDKLQQPDAPRLVILDWMMPQMSGLEVVRRVRAVKTDNPPYVILLTSKTDKADIILGLEAGANDYLAKPFDTGELRARVEVGRRMLDLQLALIESREILAYQATHDSLTGLLNRRAVLNRLSEELARVNRQGAPLAVGMCDIDHFKKINDAYGHQTGDDVLRSFSETLRESLRNYDAAGRVGGEEFLVITPMKAGTDPRSAFIRLGQQVSTKKIETKFGDVSITISIGVASTATGTMVDDILAKADAALYRAKAEGRNRVALAAGK